MSQSKNTYHEELCASREEWEAYEQDMEAMRQAQEEIDQEPNQALKSLFSEFNEVFGEEKFVLIDTRKE